MKQALWMTAALLLGAGCGGPPLPDGNDQVDPPAIPDGGPPASATSLWPMTTGSTWTYRISDPVRGGFDKHVEVLGLMRLPGSEQSAIAVRSSQPHIEELSWQAMADGRAFRVREEDRDPVNGYVKRIVTWNPLVTKSLAEPQQAGWSVSETVVETEHDGSGAITGEKEKVYTWSVEAVNETVTVPAGTFTNALRVRRIRSDKDTWEPRTYWLVPGVGKIREEGERIEELVSYEVKE